jgi:hypothetical protein
MAKKTQPKQSRQHKRHYQQEPLRQAYYAGVRDGKSEAQQLLNCCIHTNRELWNQLLTIDEVSPADGMSVPLSFVFAEHLVLLLRRHKSYTAAKRLMRRIEKAKAGTDQLIELLEKYSEDMADRSG